jgi:hypothetical protein
MQKKQIKRPYLAPELTVVDFRVERGMQQSISPEQEISNEELLRHAWDNYRMQNNYQQAMDQWGTGWTTSGSGGSSPSPLGYGWSEGGYF